MTRITSVTEGLARIEAHTSDKISKKLPVFYNPDMRFNRDVTVLLLNCVEQKPRVMVDLMAGSGIRTIRFLKELDQDQIKKIYVNDANPNAIESIRHNVHLNQCSEEKIEYSNKTADQLLTSTPMADYIDIDPFGSPNPFLDLAIKKLKGKDGILAVTATDTAPLCGTYVKACQRKYWAKPIRDSQKHEWAARILIRKVQLIGAQYDKALIPICSIAKLHFLRIFFISVRGKKAVDELIIPNHQYVHDAGPFWTGQLQQKDLIEKMCKKAPEDMKKFMDILLEESRIDVVGFTDLHKIAKETKMALPKYEKIINKLRSMGYQASRTIFSEEGVRTTADKEKIKKIMLDLSH